MVSDEGDSRSVDSDLLDRIGEIDSPNHRQSIGAYLTQQRRLRGVSREELCELTRIPNRSLTRLEEGAFDGVDDGFVRGFVRTVADALGLDPDDAVSRMCDEPTEPDALSSVSIPMLGRLGVIFAALMLVLVSAGLVSMAAQYIPGRSDSALTIVRRDPIRLLAETEGLTAFSGVRVMVPPDPADARAATFPGTVSDSLSAPGDAAILRIDTSQPSDPLRASILADGSIATAPPIRVPAAPPPPAANH